MLSGCAAKLLWEMLSFFPRFNLNRPGPGEWWRTLESEINSLNEIRFLSGSFIRGIFMGIKRSFYTKFGVCCVGTGGDRGGGRDSIKLIQVSFTQRA